MPIADLLAQITGEPSPTNTTSMTLPPRPPLPKRKATDEPLSRPAGVDKDKLQRMNNLAISANSSRPLSTSNAHSSKPSTPSSKMSPKPVKSSPPRHLDQPVVLPEPKAPKKGSFAEIMARAKNAQASFGPQVGKIQHKKIEKAPTKREREATQTVKGKNIEKLTAPGGKFAGKIEGEVGKDGRKPTANGNGNGARKKVEPPPSEKKVKKAALATTGYAGTARPGSSRPNGSKPSSSSLRNDRHGRPGYRDDRRPSSGARYAYPSDDDEIEEEEEEDEPDYASDASSDMEAGLDEVDEEEETAEKIAKREDAEALREENRLKREKEEKRRRLVAMAKKRPATRY